MSRESTDTSNNYPDKDIPDGEYLFTVQRVIKKYGGANKDKAFYIWTVGYNDSAQGEQILMPNLMGDLLRALGCKESTPNKFDWDTDDVVYSKFTATVSHEPDRKDPNKIRQTMKGFKAVGKEEDIQF
jgi:hypothetical protein